MWKCSTYLRISGKHFRQALHVSTDTEDLLDAGGQGKRSCSLASPLRSGGEVVFISGAPLRDGNHTRWCGISRARKDTPRHNFFFGYARGRRVTPRYDTRRGILSDHRQKPAPLALRFEPAYTTAPHCPEWVTAALARVSSGFAVYDLQAVFRALQRTTKGGRDIYLHIKAKSLTIKTHAPFCCTIRLLQGYPER